MSAGTPLVTAASSPVPSTSTAATARRSSAVRRVSLLRAVLFRLIVVLFFWGVLETVALTALFLKTGGWKATQYTLGAGSRSGPMDIGMINPDHVIHPYLGFVHRHNRQPDGAISSFGFRDSSSPLHRRDPDRVIVGILGGSVAELFCQSASRTLRSALQNLPEFAGKELVFVQLAMEGYKQPQHLMSVAYHMSLGAEFDVLIAIDGFNEVCLPPVENIGSNVFAAFPRDWKIRVTESSDPATLELMSLISYRRAALRNTAKWFSSSICRYSPACTLAWQTYNERLTDSMLYDMVEFNKMTPQSQSFAATGPEEHFDSPEEMYAALADVWARSSLQLHRIALANGMRYYHFLQPNQYVAGSKPFSEDEQNKAFSDEQPYAPHVVAGFPVLQQSGLWLRGQGVAFSDLTQVFVNHTETIYCDTCCHVNDRGNELLAEAIAAAIARDGQSAAPATVALPVEAAEPTGALAAEVP